MQAKSLARLDFQPHSNPVRRASDLSNIPVLWRLTSSKPPGPIPDKAHPWASMPSTLPTYPTLALGQEEKPADIAAPKISVFLQKRPLGLPQKDAQEFEQHVAKAFQSIHPSVRCWLEKKRLGGIFLEKQFPQGELGKYNWDSQTIHIAYHILNPRNTTWEKIHPYRYKAILAHEIGHFMDHQLGLSENPAIQKAYEKDLASLGEHLPRIADKRKIMGYLPKTPTIPGAWDNTRANRRKPLEEAIAQSICLLLTGEADGMALHLQHAFQNLIPAMAAELEKEGLPLAPQDPPWLEYDPQIKAIFRKDLASLPQALPDPEARKQVMRLYTGQEAQEGNLKDPRVKAVALEILMAQYALTHTKDRAKVPLDKALLQKAFPGLSRAIQDKIATEGLVPFLERHSYPLQMPR